MKGSLLQEYPQMFNGPGGPVEVFFYCPEVVFGNFYLPWASSSLLAWSPVYKYCVLCSDNPMINYNRSSDRKVFNFD